ncbi:P-loop containing nucleoside triphosphate hydrolase protein [Clavulina sp. PMI_390]|nr:P-loop containing nucleoside triphosphate hydrolase protein [Clavulina sp. PMI_390]
MSHSQSLLLGSLERTFLTHKPLQGLKCYSIAHASVQNLRLFSTSKSFAHGNPLGLPRSGERIPPKIPTRGGPPEKRPIPHVKRVIAVASGKGGVGKSMVAANLAMSLALNSHGSRPLKVGLLDLDIFGPSIPKLMGLERVGEPELSKSGALIPLINHGIPCMSMGFLLPKSPSGESDPSAAVVWRGLMVQKATQQLLFDVDWRGAAGDAGTGLDVLVVDMPPGTGDVALTFGQLVKADGAVIVSTPQDVALIDVRKGVSMFNKVSIPILGLLLNMSHFTCPTCPPNTAEPHYIFGPTTHFHKAAREMGTSVLGELPLVPGVSRGGDAGIPIVLHPGESAQEREVGEVMREVGSKIYTALDL